MPKPKNKSELLLLSQENFQQLHQYIYTLSEEILHREFPDGTMNRNIRDVLGHLHYWHLLFLDWYEVGMKGEKPDMPAKGYTWKTTPELNRIIWEKCQQVELVDMIRELSESFSKIQTIIQQHNEEELFEKKRYKWTGSTSLGAYLISNTSSHYDWAYKLIKRVHKGK